MFTVPAGSDDQPREAVQLQQQGWTVVSGATFQQTDGSVIFWLEPPTQEKTPDTKSK
jgi:hypothetical protein